MMEQHGNGQEVRPNEEANMSLGRAHVDEPRQDESRTTKSRLGILGVLGAVVALIGVFIAWQQFQRDQRLFAITEVVGKWNDNTSELKDTIEGLYPGLYNGEVFKLLKMKEAIQLYEATESDDAERYKVRQAVVELLNYFEYIALTCEYGVADERVVQGFAGGALKRWNKALGNFIQVYNKDRGSCVWEPYYKLMEKWGEPTIQCGPVS